jgi:O-acetylhomoserine/O-acetylserine sulfhydrylase-like pyridoxal-dependent enzyme
LRADGRQCENARALRGYLKEHERIGRVHYPGLARSFRSSCATNTKEAAFRFMDALKLIVRSTSLGDVFTSVLHPATASHRDLLPAKRQEWGLSMARAHLGGIEKIDDIIADIEQALSHD